LENSDAHGSPLIRDMGAVSRADSLDGVLAGSSLTTPAAPAPLPAAPPSPRAALLAHLSADMGAALAAGDLEAARIAHEAIGKLMALGLAPVDGAPVIDLATERRRRDK
jgi:hypothetical protein